MVQRSKTPVKNIYLYSHFKGFHSLYKNLVDEAPKGYRYLIPSDIKRYKQPSILARNTNRLLKQFINPVKFRDKKTRKMNLPEGTDLIYSTGNLIQKEFPWVADCEHITSFTGWSTHYLLKEKRYIEKTLSSRYCKCIMPWTEAGKQTILKNLNCDGFMEKVQTVNLSVKSKSFKKEYNYGKIKLLYVTSANFPKDFYMKGGKVVFEVFERISEKYPNVELTVRSWVPEKIKRKYQKIKNLKIIDSIISWPEVEKLFQEADIFFFPVHMTVGLAMLDAMSYELPVLTTDVWANKEMIIDNKNGLLVNPSKLVPYYTQDFIPNWRSKEYNKAVLKADQEFSKEVYNKLIKLIENKNLRRRMGGEGRKMIEKGKFSTKTRNKNLKRIYDSSLI